MLQEYSIIRMRKYCFLNTANRHTFYGIKRVNVSFSTEFLTTEALIRANTLYANGCLRRYFGLKPSFKNSPSFVNYLKVIYARIVKLMGGYKGKNTLPVPHFTLDKENLGKLNFDKDYDASVLN